MGNVKSINHKNFCKWNGCVSSHLPNQDYCKSHQELKDFQKQLNNKANQYYKNIYGVTFHKEVKIEKKDNSDGFDLNKFLLEKSNIVNKNKKEYLRKIGSIKYSKYTLIKPSQQKTSINQEIKSQTKLAKINHFTKQRDFYLDVIKELKQKMQETGNKALQKTINNFVIKKCNAGRIIASLKENDKK